MNYVKRYADLLRNHLVGCWLVMVKWMQQIHRVHMMALTISVINDGICSGHETRNYEFDRGLDKIVHAKHVF